MAPDVQFIEEAVAPDPASFDTARMAAGEPGLPRRFTWRGRVVEVAEVRRTWRETGPCRHGSGEQYVRKHWYEVRTADGDVMTLYFERSTRRPGARRRSWWLHTIGEPSRTG
jgi:hypothetical protein